MKLYGGSEPASALRAAAVRRSLGEGGRTRSTLIAAIIAVLTAAPAAAQVDGYVSVMAVAFPDLQPDAGRQRVGELRARIFVERALTAGEHLRFHLSGYVDGLAADRAALGVSGTRTDVIARPGDLYAEIVTPRFDLRVGASRQPRSPRERGRRMEARIRGTHPSGH